MEQVLMAAARFPRQRKRYLAFRVEGQTKRNELEQAIKQLSKELGIEAKLVIERYDASSQSGLIRARHTDALKLREALQKPVTFQGRQISIKTIGTSGTVKTAVKKYFKPQSE